MTGAHSSRGWFMYMSVYFPPRTEAHAPSPWRRWCSLITSRVTWSSWVRLPSYESPRSIIPIDSEDTKFKSLLPVFQK